MVGIETIERQALITARTKLVKTVTDACCGLMHLRWNPILPELSIGSLRFFIKEPIINNARFLIELGHFGLRLEGTIILAMSSCTTHVL